MQLFSQTSNNMDQLSDRIKEHEHQIKNLTCDRDRCTQCMEQQLIQLNELRLSQRFPDRKKQLNECYLNIERLESRMLEFEQLIEKNKHHIKKLQQKKEVLEQITQMQCQNSVTVTVNV